LPSNAGAERARFVASALPARAIPARRGERGKLTGEAGESVLTHMLKSQCWKQKIKINKDIHK
jgi:hypothetical protein